MILMRTLPLTFLLLILHTSAHSNEAKECETSDLVLSNTTIYTADSNRPTADVLAIRDGRLVFVGQETDAAPWLCGAKRIIELPAAVVYPGFTDGHQHLEGIGRRTRSLSLFGIPTLAGTVARIEDWSRTVKEGDWILGRGWIEREWTDQQRFLTRHLFIRQKVSIRFTAHHGQPGAQKYVDWRIQ